MKSLLILFFLLSTLFTLGQEDFSTTTVWRFNFVNPGAELEVPVTQNSTFSTNIGVGYNGSYPELTEGVNNGVVYIIAPFLDLQYKYFYNFKKRLAKNKSTNNNSGNFISWRMVTRGPSITDNVFRTSDFDFAVGPTWGIQRSYGNFHLLFDVGPQLYFDTEGNSGFWPIMPQLNIGCNFN